MPNPQWAAKPVEPSDERFWHATTWAGVTGLYNAPSIDPTRGNGANGLGFYVCPQRSDYQKVMAYRSFETQTTAQKQRGLFLLRILAKGFYEMTGSYADGLGVALGDEDFAASRWAPDVLGFTQYKRPDGTKVNYEGRTKLASMAPKVQSVLEPLPHAPSGAKKFTMPGATVTDAKPGKLVVKTKLTLGSDDLKASLTDVKGYKLKNERLDAARQVLWELARQNAPTLPVDGALNTTGIELLDRIIKFKGARKAYRYSLEEITFRAKAGPKLFIIDAFRFYYTAPDTDPLADEYDNERRIGLDELGREIAAFPK